MKSKNMLQIALFSVIMLFATQVDAQKFGGLDKSPMDVASFPDNWRESDKLVKIQYGRPQLNKRSLSKLAPNGEVWRTGANEVPEITFYVDMKLDGKTIKAGTYSLLTIPGETEWTIILHSGLNEWGAYTYNKDNDVARAVVPATMAEDSLEALA